MGTPVFFVNRFIVIYARDNIEMTIGERLKVARKNAKLTQVELAKRVNLKQSTLSDLEVGKSVGSTSIAALANALGVSALWLETGRGDKMARPEPTDFKEQRAPRMILAYDDEAQLLDFYRRADERGRREIMDMAAYEGQRAVLNSNQA